MLHTKGAQENLLRALSLCAVFRVIGADPTPATYAKDIAFRRLEHTRSKLPR